MFDIFWDTFGSHFKIQKKVVESEVSQMREKANYVSRLELRMQKTDKRVIRSLVTIFCFVLGTVVMCKCILGHGTKGLLVFVLNRHRTEHF